MTVHEKLAPQSSTPSTEVPSDVAEIAPERPTPGSLCLLYTSPSPRD